MVRHIARLARVRREASHCSRAGYGRSGKRTQEEEDAERASSHHAKSMARWSLHVYLATPWQCDGERSDWRSGRN